MEYKCQNPGVWMSAHRTHWSPCLQMMIYHKTPNYHFLALGGWCRLCCISFLTVAIVSIPVSTFDSWYSSPSLVANTFITWLIFPWRRIGIVFVPEMIQNGELIHKSVFGPSSNDINTALYHFSLLSCNIWHQAPTMWKWKEKDI